MNPAPHPQPGIDRWQFLMRRGDFASAWEICDGVLRERAGKPCAHLPRHEQWIWDGTPLAGKRVLIRCYHGLGDTVQFIRFAPLVKAIAREVIVWAQPALLPILRTAHGIDRLLPLHDGTPEVDYDVDVESMELTHVFRTTLETLPVDVPYLYAAPSRLALQPNLLHVGLVWCAGDWDTKRDVPVNLLRPLTRVAGVELHILQRGNALHDWPRGVGRISGDDRVGQLASTLRALDLLISIDTFPAHLAGALGVPTWVLLHANPDWRWMDARDDSPWYPTMRLFRQPRQGDWDAVIARVAAELTDTVFRKRQITARNTGLTTGQCS